MQLWLDPPGVALEPGRYTALVAPPEPLLALLARPELDRFMALYLYGVSSRVLHRLPRRPPAALALQSCMTVHQVLAALRGAHQTIVILEYDPEIFSALEDEQREAVWAVGRALRELASSSLVLLYAGQADRGVRALARTADQTVYLYGAVPPPRAAAPGAAPRRARPAQRTLAEGGWG